MGKENTVMSFRFEEHILEKIDYLVEKENEKLRRFSLKPVTKKHVMEEIIKDYYYRQINNSRDADVVDRINELIIGQVKVAMGGIINDIEEILFLCIKNDLGNRVFYRSPSVLPAPDSKETAIEVITEETSKWDLALEEYMYRKWKNEKVHVHEVQEDDDDYYDEN